MAFRKVLAVALCLSAAYAAPQGYQSAADASFVRAATPLTHVVAAQPALRTVAVAHQPATVAVRTVAAPATTVTHLEHADEYVAVDDHPQYSFGYQVADSLSGDAKTRQETRDGDFVSGSYSVADADGRVRTVEYTADPVHGFQADVRYDGAPGPVAIPFNAPETAFVSSPAFVEAADTDVAIINARNQFAGVDQVQAVHNVHTAPRTVAVAAAPVAVRTQAVHAVNPLAVRAQTFSHANPLAVRAQAFSHANPLAVRAQAVHAVNPVVRTQAVHSVAAAPQFVRTQAVHAAPQLVRTVAAAPQFVRAAAPSAFHASHATPNVVGPAVLRTSGLRAVNTHVVAQQNPLLAGRTFATSPLLAGNAFAGRTFAGNAFANNAFANNAFAGNAFGLNAGARLVHV